MMEAIRRSDKGAVPFREPYSRFEVATGPLERELGRYRQGPKRTGGGVELTDEVEMVGGNTISHGIVIE